MAEFVTDTDSLIIYSYANPLQMSKKSLFKGYKDK